MSFLGDMLKRVTGKQPEPQKPKAEAAKPSPAAFRINNNVPEHRGPGPSPTARIMEKMPDVKAQAKAVYNGEVAPKPGPLNQPTPQTAAQQPTRRPTENTPQPRPTGGPRPGPTVAAPGMGGAYSSVRTPPQQPRPTPPPAPAQQPAARKPPVKTFEQFIGAGKPGHKL